MRSIVTVALLAVASVSLAAKAPKLDEADLDARIEALRKGDFAVRVPGGRGPVTYALVRHAFPFGTCVNQSVLLADSPDGARYREHLVRYFNSAVDEYAMKWKPMEPQPGVHRDEAPLRVWETCDRLGLPMRGHCLFWGVNQGPADWHKTLEPGALEAAMKARLARVLGLFRGKIGEWDLNNEMIHGDLYAKKLGLESGAAYFKWARAVDPDVRLYVNDYSILSGGDTDKYVRHIERLIADGADVGGIGVQGHFGKGVGPSDRLWAKLDKLARFRLPIKITEFDINTKDEDAQAADTRRFYKLCFAHPAVKGILMWGFWEGRHWRPRAALWRKDWTAKPNGEAYAKLVTEEWTTRGTGEADASGRVRFRGFYGTYRLTQGGLTFEATLTPQRLETNATPAKEAR